MTHSCMLMENMKNALSQSSANVIIIMVALERQSKPRKDLIGHITRLWERNICCEQIDKFLLFYRTEG